MVLRGFVLSLYIRSGALRHKFSLTLSDRVRDFGLANDEIPNDQRSPKDQIEADSPHLQNFPINLRKTLGKKALLGSLGGSHDFAPEIGNSVFIGH